MQPNHNMRFKTYKNMFRVIAMLAAILLLCATGNVALAQSNGVFDGAEPHGATISPTTADAAPLTDDMLRDWNKLANYLRSQGIDPVSVNWRAISPLCVGLKDPKDVRPYHRCRYEKARDSHFHAVDRRQCAVKAKATYPDDYARLRATETIREVNADGKVRVFERVPEPLSFQEIKNLREASIVECMQSFGWIDAGYWESGRRSVVR